jgi:hypothetical protein
MRQRLLLGLLGLSLLLAAYLSWAPRAPARMPAYTPRRPRRSVIAAPPSTDPAGATPAPRLQRNPFEYGGVPAAAAAPPHTAKVPARTPPTATEATPEPKVTLVGIVHRGTGSRAALNIEGTVVVLDVGESAEGYTVVAVDEDTGARVRTPDGHEITLAPPR